MKCATVACVKHERPHAVSSEQQSHSCLSLFLTGFMRISVAKDRRGSGTLWPTLNSFLKLLSHSFIKISVKYLFIQTVVTVTECVVSISTLFSCSVKTLFLVSRPSLSNQDRDFHKAAVWLWAHREQDPSFLLLLSVWWLPLQVHVVT